MIVLSACIIFIIGIIILLMVPDKIKTENIIYKENDKLSSLINTNISESFNKTDTIYILTDRSTNVDCGTGYEESFSDRINQKFYTAIDWATHNPYDVNKRLIVDKFEMLKNAPIIYAEMINLQTYKMQQEIAISTMVNRIPKAEYDKVYELKFDKLEKDLVEISIYNFDTNNIILSQTFILKNNQWIKK